MRLQPGNNSNLYITFVKQSYSVWALFLCIYFYLLTIFNIILGYIFIYFHIRFNLFQTSRITSIILCQKSSASIIFCQRRTIKYKRLFQKYLYNHNHINKPHQIYYLMIYDLCYDRFMIRCK